MILGYNFIKKYSPVIIDKMLNTFTKKEKQILVPRYFIVPKMFKLPINISKENFQEMYLNSMIELFYKNPLKLFDRSSRYCKIELIREYKRKNLPTKLIVYPKEDVIEF